MPQNKIVARFQDGRVLKGFSVDFLAGKEVFHLTPADAIAGSKPVEVRLSELKAVFFVRVLEGNPRYEEQKEFPSKGPAVGRKLRVVFRDGETLLGTTQGYQPGRAGFFLIPADPKSNNERCFVITAATQEVAFV
jgi:hypothetical protein